MSKADVYKVLKNVYEGGNLGWYCTQQIRKMLLDIGIDIGLASINHNLNKLSLDNEIDRIPNTRGFLYRYRHPKKNKLFT